LAKTVFISNNPHQVGERQVFFLTVVVSAISAKNSSFFAALTVLAKNSF